MKKKKENNKKKFEFDIFFKFFLIIIISQACGVLFIMIFQYEYLKNDIENM